MKAARIAGVVSLLALSLSVRAANQRAVDVVNQLEGTKRVLIDRSDVPDELHADVIAVLRSRAAAGSGVSTAVLLRLGDNETVQKEVQHFVETEGTDWMRMRPLRTTPSLALAAAVAPLMFRDEELRFHGPKPYDGQGSWGVSYESAIIVRGNLEVGAPDVPPTVAEWARTVPTQSLPALRDTMRQWWLENREHFEKGEIDQLQPLKGAVDDATAAVASVATKETDQQSTAPPPSPATASPRVADSPAPAGSGSMELRSWWLWAGGAAVVIALGWIIWRAR